jgi:hypothetical protein
MNDVPNPVLELTGSASYDAVAGNVIERHGQTGDFSEW